MKGLAVVPQDLERAIGVFEKFPPIALPGRLIHSQRNLTHREIVELVALALGFDNGGVAVDMSVGFASITFRCMDECIGVIESSRRKQTGLLAQVEAPDIFPEDYHTRVRRDIAAQLQALDMQTHEFLELMLGLRKRIEAPEAVKRYFRAKGIEVANVSFFLGELANAVLRLAQYESKYKCDEIRPHIMGILQHKNPPELVIQAGIV